MKNVIVSIPKEDVSFFTMLIEKMGWSLQIVPNDDLSSYDQLSKNCILEENPLKLNITLTNYYNIRKGKKKIYRHSISDYDCAYKIFHHNYDKISISEEFCSIDKEWTFTDIHNGQCPFIIRQYKNVVFTCEALKKSIEIEIDGQINVKYNKESKKWYFEFKIGKIKKIY